MLFLDPPRNDLARVPTGSGNLKVPDDAPVLHFMLTIENFGTSTENPTKKTLSFRLVPVLCSATALEVKDYALGISEKTIENKNVVKRESVFDIFVKQQCYIVIQLDPSINWRFSAGSHGLSRKLNISSTGAEEDYDLNFVSNGIATGPGGEVPVDCRILYWAVNHRPKDTAREFNFHIDFIEVLGGKERLMPTIFDPSVPNTGGAAFP
jgi:hypothetical protein